MACVDVYLEFGAKRVFACAVDWPGWCRSGPDEAAALRALLDSTQRCAAVIRPARLGFAAPTLIEDLRVVERLKGNATTDFGAPGAIPSCDRGTADADEHRRFVKVPRTARRSSTRWVRHPAARSRRSVRAGGSGGRCAVSSVAWRGTRSRTPGKSSAGSVERRGPRAARADPPRRPAPFVDSRRGRRLSSGRSPA